MKLPPGGQRDMPWYGSTVPDFSDVLIFRSGRRYQVIGRKGKSTLRVLVLKPDDEIEPDTVVWNDCHWMARKPRTA